MLVRSPIALLVLGVLFVPLERLFPLRRAQSVLRRGWQTDVAHFFGSHLLEQLALVLAVGGVLTILEPLVSPRVQDAVAAQPLACQLAEALLVTELVGYAMHRAFHEVPWLWRIHAVHHSSEALDWLAGLRVHPLDQTLTRAAQFAPLYLLGFPPELFASGAVLLGLWAITLHANVRLRLGWLEHVIASPRFHHWHHARDARGNYAGLFPWLDRLFGTRLDATAWPPTYGTDAPVPPRWHAQLLFPLSGRRPQAPESAAEVAASRR